MSGPQVGARGSAELTVAAGDTAQALGSGDVPVLGTPRLLALVEAAAVAALRDSLEEGSTSVGVAVELEHLAATPVGGVVRAEVVVTRVEGRAVDFAVSAHDQRGEVARGVHRRSVVDRTRFLRHIAGDAPG